MRKKNKILLIAGLTALCSMCVFAGCNPPESSSGVSGETLGKIEKVEGVTLELNKTVLANMVIGDENLLHATFTEISGESLQWESSNKQVATVEKVSDNIAKVVAYNAGEATITATYGTYTQTCTVSVTQNGIYPALHLANGVTDEAVIEKGGQLDLSSYVLFNGKQFEDMQVTYALSDPSFGTIDGEANTFTAGNNAGTTTITLTANWRNIPSELLTKKITVKVVSSTVVSINNGTFSQIELYTVASLQGNTYKNEQAITSIKVIEDGQAVSDYKVSITDHQPADGTDRDVAVWDGEKIVANAYGKANFTVSIGDDYSVSYPINVKRPLVEYKDQIKWFSYLDGELPTYEIFAEAAGEMEIIEAYQGGRVLDVQEGKVFGVTSTAMDAMTVQTLEVYNDKVGYTIDVETYAQVIDEAEDMNFMYDGTLVGYVYLKNNIVVPDQIAWAGTAACFGGVFEGNGYKITMQPRQRGVFGGKITGTVRNVWFEFINFRNLGNYATNALIGTDASQGATFENIYVTIDEATANPKKMQSIALFESVGKKTTIRNFVANFGSVLPESGYSYEYYGLLCQYLGSSAADCKYENFYFISSGLKHLVNSHSKDTPNTLSITYAANDAALMQADKEADADEDDQQYVLESIKRYDTVEDFIADVDNDLTNFDTRYWDVTTGYPTWRTIQATVNGVESYNIALFNTANEQENSATIGVQVLGEDVSFTLSVESGDADVISIVDNKVTAKQGVIGSAVVVATYQLDKDEIKIRFRVDVLPAMTDKVIYWGTELEQSYVPDGLLKSDETVETITDFETSALLYSVANGYNATLLKNEGSEVKEFRAIVRGSKGTVVTLTVRSYTLLISTASDLNFIAPKTALNGSYVLLNDIIVEEWTQGLIGENEKSASTYFNGVFDGNGYTISYPVRAFGLFGNIGSTAKIKNVKLVVTALDGYKASANTGIILGFWMEGLLENLYVQIQGDIKNSEGLALFTASGKGGLTTATIRNVVIDAGTSYANYDLSTNGAYGMLALGATTATCQNVYVISNMKALSGLSKGYTGSAISYTYAENDATGAEGEVIISGVRRYKNIDVMKADQNKDLTSFDETFWDKTDGALVWKNK